MAYDKMRANGRMRSASRSLGFNQPTEESTCGTITVQPDEPDPPEQPDPPAQNPDPPEDPDPQPDPDPPTTDPDPDPQPDPQPDPRPPRRQLPLGTTALLGIGAVALGGGAFLAGRE